MSATTPKKSRKLQGSCDICRRQKVRCDSATMPGNRCSKCIAFDSECTHNSLQSTKVAREKRARRKRAQSSPEMETARSLVNGLISGYYQIPEEREAVVQLLLQVSRYARCLEQPQSTTSSVQAGTSSSSDGEEGDPNSDPAIGINPETLPDRLKGPSASIPDHEYREENGSVLFIVGAIEARQKDVNIPHGPRSKRPLFWSPLPWEASPSSEVPVTQTFPPNDLLRDLVDIYFTQLNIFSFILHRPTFEQALADGQHLSDSRFGSVVLAVCALAIKISSDERVLLLGEGDLSAGWKWFRQIPRPFSGTPATACIYDLQLCCLYISFQKLSLQLESCWLLCGIGMLYAQEMGAHRRKRQRQDKEASWNVEAELSTRCCYYLSMFDATHSYCFDRPRAAEALERELHLPALCDEEYWDNPDPARAFQQPPGQPSLAAYNLSYIKLMSIYASLSRAGDTASIAQIDSRLDQWATEIPEHLLWNPYMKDDVFFAQSASLYTQYYHVQILLHRPLLHTVKDAAPSPSAFKSLAICANAARSTAHVTDVRSHRPSLNQAENFKAVFDAAVVLVLNISGGARFGLSIDTGRELVAVYQCMELLRRSERRAQNAGWFNDLLCELLHLSELPLPESWATQVAIPNQWPEHSLPTAVEDLGSLPVYDSLAQMDSSTDMGTILPQSNEPSVVPHLSGATDAPLGLENLDTSGDRGAFANFNDVEMDAYMLAQFCDSRCDEAGLIMPIGRSGFRTGRVRLHWSRRWGTHPHNSEALPQLLRLGRNVKYEGD
ncbi:hypothetical protein C8R43DRAFT_39486 [Mycena crocata]|nr:hypothetical protein C8R43DRAFT_39486 [Mycena crocata]